MLRCATCNEVISAGHRDCLVCSSSAGFPNVRLAEEHAEADALDRRYAEAWERARTEGKESELGLFEEEIKRSKAVMNRSLGALISWITGQSPFFITFYRQIEVLGREPASNEWDRARESAEAAINSYCYRDLNFAALTLDNSGMDYYGPYSIILKTETIEHRASIFEENPFNFLTRYNVIAGTSPPVGYRSTWQRRNHIAVAKLHAYIAKHQSKEAFSRILMSMPRNNPKCDFIEVHIFGPIHRAGIEKIAGPPPKNPVDQILWNHIKMRAGELGILVEQTS